MKYDNEKGEYHLTFVPDEPGKMGKINDLHIDLHIKTREQLKDLNDYLMSCLGPCFI